MLFSLHSYPYETTFCHIITFMHLFLFIYLCYASHINNNFIAPCISSHVNDKAKLQVQLKATLWEVKLMGRWRIEMVLGDIIVVARRFPRASYSYFSKRKQISRVPIGCELVADLGFGYQILGSSLGSVFIVRVWASRDFTCSG